MDIRTGSADFSSLRGSGPRTAQQAIVFPRNVDKAAVGLLGYSVEFGDNNDHNFGRCEIRVEATITANVVTVTSTLGLRDFSGDWDDDYLGSVDFAVLADLVSATAPPPRNDMVIVDMEANQAVQFFRAAAFLDAASVLPDNAIRLVANKATGLRVYVDYDAFSGLPVVSHLTGQMTVNTGGTSFTLDPINAGGAIAPRADSQVNQAVADQTLNFMLDGSWSVGTVTVTVQVWDQAAPATKSAPFTRTLTFTDVAALDVFVVGVHYTAQGLDLAAPSLGDIVSAMGRLRSTYPVGDVSINGYTAIDYGEDVNFTITSSGGCGDGMDDLLDKLDDMQGGSSDTYVGFLPQLSLISTPGSNIGGCGTPGRGVIFIDQTADVPHEVGHALGHKHAPCSPGVCNPPPANVDDHYPQYGSFPAGSIGVFGFDPASNTVFDPASTADFMAYWGPQWVSAYTYMGLAGAFPATGGGGGPGLSHAHALGNVPVETLMLKLVVSRDRAVKRLPSFHFESLPRRTSAACSEFTVELLDACRRTLVCATIDCGCQLAGCHCWPRKMQGAIPFPPGARWLLVYEDDRKIHEECIPLPPRLKITGTKPAEAGTLVCWEPVAVDAERAALDCCDDDCGGLTYVVHWFDEEDGVWRGVVPRTQRTEALIPARLTRRGGARVRVLATRGVATGFVELALKPGGSGDGNGHGTGTGTGPGNGGADGSGSGNGNGNGNGNGGGHCGVDPTKPTKPARGDTPTIHLEGYDGKAHTATVGTHVLRATAVDELGKSVAPLRVRWYDEQGAELAVGPALDLRRLPIGRNVIRVAMRTEDGVALGKSWVIERNNLGHRVQSAIDVPLPDRKPGA